MTSVSDLCAALEAIAPIKLAEPWDNVGLLIGDPDSDVTKVLLAIDCTPAVFDEARALGCEMIVAYHPVMFEGIKKLTRPSLPWRAVREGVAIFAPHTALDIADGGTNDVLADAVGMTSRAPLRALKEPGRQAILPGGGIGRIGPIAPASRPEVIARIKHRLSLDAVMVSGPMEGEVTHAAVGAGACGDLILDVIARAPGLYLTGELRHHDALKAAAHGVTVVMTLHTNSERAVLARLETSLAARCPGVSFARAQTDRDPFAVY